MNRRSALGCIGAIGLSPFRGAGPASCRAGGESPRADDSKRVAPFVPLEREVVQEQLDSVCFSSGGRLLAAGGQALNAVQLVDTASLDGSGREPRVQVSGPSPVPHLWNAGTGRLAQQFPACRTAITAVGFDSEASHLLTAEDTRYVPINEEIRTNKKDMRPAGCFTGRELITGPEGSTVRIWNRLSGFEELIPLRHEGTVILLAAARQYITAVDTAGNVRVWHAADGRPLATYSRGEGPPGGKRRSRPSLFSAAINLDGTRVLIQSDAGPSMHYDVREGAGRRWEDRGGSVAPIAFGPDGRRFATWSRAGRPLLWDFETMTMVRACEFQGPAMPNRGSAAMAFDPDGTRLAFAWTEASGPKARDVAMRVDVWDVGTGRFLGEVRATGYLVRALAFTPGGDLRVAIGGGSTIGADGHLQAIPLSIWHVPRI
jgi:WD40 repeat protein